MSQLKNCKAPGNDGVPNGGAHNSPSISADFIHVSYILGAYTGLPALR